MRPSRFPMAVYPIVVFLCSAFTSTSALASAQTAPDNSGQNKSQTTTAGNQSNAKADRVTTAQVRKAIMADNDLSTYGHNVKIITMNGSVTLKGPVKSEKEKQTIASDAAGGVSTEKNT